MKERFERLIQQAHHQQKSLALNLLASTETLIVAKTDAAYARALRLNTQLWDVVDRVQRLVPKSEPDAFYPVGVSKH